MVIECSFCFVGVAVNVAVHPEHPLYLSCFVSDLDSVRVLVKTGADPKTPTKLI